MRRSLCAAPRIRLRGCGWLRDPQAPSSEVLRHPLLREKGATFEEADVGVAGDEEVLADAADGTVAFGDAPVGEAAELHLAGGGGPGGRGGGGQVGAPRVA